MHHLVTAGSRHNSPRWHVYDRDQRRIPIIAIRSCDVVSGEGPGEADGMAEEKRTQRDRQTGEIYMKLKRIPINMG